MSEEEERDPLRLFEAYGIEVEYMIVSRDGLDVRPVADQLLADVAGEPAQELERGEIGWSNELALHVVEFKTNGPRPDLSGLAEAFAGEVSYANQRLEGLDACLLPTAMHPWMDPFEELRLWPHENDVIYETFDRIFDCRGHGWSNLQSVHVNLPFADDVEFGRLHAAIRMALPILPGLSASSPFVDGAAAGRMDHRLHTYKSNARRVPSVSGRVVPEPVYDRARYQDLLQSIYSDLAPHDPAGVLRHEWVNARGCIARFDRMAIEIRTLDVQECPSADGAMVAAVVNLVRHLTEEHHLGLRGQKEWPGDALVALHDAAIQDGDQSVVEDRRFLDALGYPDPGRARLRELWLHLKESLPTPGADEGFWSTYADEGCLARRIDQAVREYGPGGLSAVYRRLAEGLAEDRRFTARD